MGCEACDAKLQRYRYQSYLILEVELLQPLG